MQVERRRHEGRSICDDDTNDEGYGDNHMEDEGYGNGNMKHEGYMRRRRKGERWG